MRILNYFLHSIGRSFLDLIQNAGGVSLLFLDAVRMIPRSPYRIALLIKQMEFIGYKSVPIVILTGGFTGMVFGLQCYIGFKRFGSEVIAGTIVAMAMIRELGPTLSAIMVAARAGSAMTAEIGTMKVTEQIDALHSMAVDPVHYLVVPRLIASALVMPLLNGICIVFGLLGGYIVNVMFMGTNSTLYIDNSLLYSTGTDIFHSMIKAFVFGLIIASVSCYCGFKARMGAEGVGKATTLSVVESCVLILMFDYIITSIVLS